MAFSRVMRNDAYTPGGRAKKSALSDCGISARNPCKKAVDERPRTFKNAQKNAGENAAGSLRHLLVLVLSRLLSG
jgi:hypothetical protein